MQTANFFLLEQHKQVITKELYRYLPENKAKGNRSWESCYSNKFAGFLTWSHPYLNRTWRCVYYCTVFSLWVDKSCQGSSRNMTSARANTKSPSALRICIYQMRNQIKRNFSLYWNYLLLLLPITGFSHETDSWEKTCPNIKEPSGRFVFVQISFP